MGPADIRALWTVQYPNYISYLPHKMAMAESQFVSINPTELIRGFRFDCHHNSPFCVEIWRTGEQLIEYRYWLGGDQLQTHAVNTLPAVIEKLQTIGRDRSRIKAVEEYGPSSASSDGTS
jgi:hypothetical protein